MVSLHEDQAAGLRRLFARRHARIVLLLGARGAAEQSAATLDLARGLAAAQQRVVVIDEQAAPHSVAQRLGLATRFDLMQAIGGDVRPAQVVVQAEPGLSLLSAARLARQGGTADAAQQQALAGMLRGIGKGADFVLVNGYTGRSLTALALAAQRALIVAGEGSSAATEAYRLFRQLRHGAPRARIGVLARGGAAQRAACAQLVEVARSHGRTEVELFAAGDGDSAEGQLLRSLLHAPRQRADMRYEEARTVNCHRPALANPMVY